MHYQAQTVPTNKKPHKHSGFSWRMHSGVASRAPKQIKIQAARTTNVRQRSSGASLTVDAPNQGCVIA
jgi:hypothetical protein